MKRAKRKFIDYNPASTMHGYDNVRWVENASLGLRRVGFADQIAEKEGHWRAIDHKGWFTDDDCEDDTLRGVVYQLPARDGCSMYVYGYADPDNDDCALLCFNHTSEIMQAARYSDSFAERFADEQRNYKRAWRAGRDYDELAEEIKQARTQALKLAEEMRAAKRARVQAPTICAVLRGQILSLYRSIQNMREKRADLFGNFGTCDGFVE